MKIRPVSNSHFNNLRLVPVSRDAACEKVYLTNPCITRHFFILISIIFVLLSFYSGKAFSNNQFEKQLKVLEKQAGGRIGLSAYNTGNHKYYQFRANEMFPLCSTAKLMVVSAVLNKSKTDPGLLEKRIHYNQNNLVSYSPVTAKHAGEGMTISELCSAAIAQSDNAAMNLLLKQLGGPDKVNAFARSINNKAFHLEHTEPFINSLPSKVYKDRTTAKAMEQSIYQLLFANVLPEYQRKLLLTWLRQNTTGDQRIRSGVPHDWIVGDKTGTCDYGTTIYPSHLKMRTTQISDVENYH